MARLACVACSAWRPAESTVLSAERLADRVFLGGRGRERFVVYFEFYTAWVPTAPRDMLAKLALLGIFGKLGYPALDAKQIIGVEKMKESKFYQEITQEGELLASRTEILRVLWVHAISLE